MARDGRGTNKEMMSTNTNVSRGPSAARRSVAIPRVNSSKQFTVTVPRETTGLKLFFNPEPLVVDRWQ
jgi:hypothetical protein